MVWLNLVYHSYLNSMDVLMELSVIYLNVVDVSGTVSALLESFGVCDGTKDVVFQ